jgi:hypothetical protein
MRPKKFVDLDLFGRALRLRWLWFQWTAPERPWVGTEPPVNAVDKQLFRASTTVTLGDGEMASFWQSSWMDGHAPMDLYPALYRLAWRKNRSVKEELMNQSWTRGLWRMETVSEMANFVELWDKVQAVQLTANSDTIKWKWTADGVYTAKSAYVAQFQGSYSLFKGSHIWQAETEGKHKFFAWLFVQSKILTADKLLVRNWPCNPVCALCSQEPETASHLILHCSFARQIWDRMAAWTANLIQIPAQGIAILDWWQKELVHLSKKARKLKAAMMIYGAWNIWKARNRRVFEQKTLTPAEVMQEIKMEVNCRKLACGGPELSSFND